MSIHLNETISSFCYCSSSIIRNFGVSIIENNGEPQQGSRTQYSIVAVLTILKKNKTICLVSIKKE